MTTPALSAAPPNALLLWTDNFSLFIELPGPDGRPYIIRHPLTASGLSAALGIIRTRAYDSADRTITNPAPRVGTLTQHLTATDLLRQLRMIR